MILEGKTLAAQLKANLAARAERVRQQLGRTLHLAAIGSREDFGAYTYLQKEVKAALALGISAQIFELDSQTPVQDFLHLVRTLSQDDKTDAVLIARPLPDHLANAPFAQEINPQKDIDGMSNISVGNLFLCRTWDEVCALKTFVPSTALAVMKLLDYHHIDLDGKEVAVIGRSANVGRPLAHLLTCKNATTKICHTHTDLARALTDCDVICSAAGHAGLLNAAWLKPNSVVVDISTNWHDNHLCGDADPLTLAEKNISFSPVPGGVGPITLAVLLENIILSKERYL
jgi:methylenetetrahydrofolate dehydrogenase (NADP+)/methenyltetrahydrofolate cyclohydrolase